MYLAKKIFKGLGYALIPVFMLVWATAVAFLDLAIGDPMYLSAHRHIEYALYRQPVCKDSLCTVAIKMTNKNPDDYHLDFPGFDGPGFAERGTWGAYFVGKDGKRCEAVPDDASYGLSIPPNKSVVVELSVKNCFTYAQDVHNAEIFETTVNLYN